MCVCCVCVCLLVKGLSHLWSDFEAECQMHLQLVCQNRLTPFWEIEFINDLDKFAICHTTTKWPAHSDRRERERERERKRKRERDETDNCGSNPLAYVDHRITLRTLFFLIFILMKREIQKITKIQIAMKMEWKSYRLRRRRLEKRTHFC